MSDWRTAAALVISNILLILLINPLLWWDEIRE